jgi:hypothetical protein
MRNQTITKKQTKIEAVIEQISLRKSLLYKNISSGRLKQKQLEI